MPNEIILQTTKPKLVAAFKLWLDPNQGTPYTDEEWEALSQEQQAEIYADYLIKLLSKVSPC